jgi:hypothetical protein
LKVYIKIISTISTGLTPELICIRAFDSAAENEKNKKMMTAREKVLVFITLYFG